MIAAARLKKASADRNEAYKMIDELLANGDLTSEEHSTARADATAEFEQMAENSNHERERKLLHCTVAIDVD